MAFTDSKEIEKKRMEIVSFIKRYIVDNNLDAGDKILSENKLASLFKTNRNTVRSALISLKIRGILYSQKGKGFFVAEKPSKFLIQYDTTLGLSETLNKSNMEYSISLLHVVKRKATDKELHYLKLAENEEIFELLQLRYVKDVPFAICASIIPEKITPDLDVRLQGISNDFEGTSDLFINEYGMEHPICSKVFIHSYPPGEKEMRLLDIPDNIPILQQESVYTIKDSVPVEYFIIKGRSDRFKISFELNK